MERTDGRSPPRGRPDHPPPATTMALAATVGPDDIPALCDRLAGLLRTSRTGVVVCDVSAIIEPDAGTLDVLARLQLTARRLGGRMRLHEARRPLRALLAFSGLGEALPLCVGPVVELPWREHPVG